MKYINTEEAQLKKERLLTLKQNAGKPGDNSYPIISFPSSQRRKTKTKEIVFYLPASGDISAQ
jgi:hypothetical protein